MRITISWDSFNGRRYSRPWVARITAWPVGSRPAISWGNYLGNDSGGELEIEAAPGDVLRYGQKDRRGNGTINRYAIVLEDGSRLKVSEPNASRYYHAADKAATLRELIIKHQQALNAQIEFDSWLDQMREENPCPEGADKMLHRFWAETEYNRRDTVRRNALKEFAI
jgi:hypothetical protein